MPARSADDVRIEAYGGPRDHLRPLFELTDPGDPRHAEVKNMAVRETRQGRGWGAGSSRPPSTSSRPKP